MALTVAQWIYHQVKEIISRGTEETNGGTTLRGIGWKGKDSSVVLIP